MTIISSSSSAFPSFLPMYQQQAMSSSNSKAFENLQISLPSTRNLLDSQQQQQENSNQLSALLELNPSPVPSLMKHSPTNSSSSCSLWSSAEDETEENLKDNFADQLFPALPEQDEDWLQFGWLLDGEQQWEEQQHQKKVPEEVDDRRWDKEERERNSSSFSSATTEAGLLSSAATCGSTNSSSNDQNASETGGEVFFGGSSTCTITTGISSAAFGKTTDENAPAEAQEQQPIAMRTRSHPNPKNNGERHHQQKADDERQEEEEDDASLNWTLDSSLQEQQQNSEDLLWKWLVDVQKRRRTHTQVRRNHKQRKTTFKKAHSTADESIGNFSKAVLPENMPKRKRRWHEIAAGRHGIKKRKCYAKQWPKAPSSSAISAESHCPQCQQRITPKELVPNGTEKEEKMMEEEELFCTCREPYNEFSFYVGCDHCNGWFHPECIGTTQEHILAIEGQPFFCPNCRSP